jgi:hypothetical protein
MPNLTSEKLNIRDFIGFTERLLRETRSCVVETGPWRLARSANSVLFVFARSARLYHSNRKYWLMQRSMNAQLFDVFQSRLMGQISSLDYKIVFER